MDNMYQLSNVYNVIPAFLRLKYGSFRRGGTRLILEGQGRVATRRMSVTQTRDFCWFDRSYYFSGLPLASVASHVLTSQPPPLYTHKCLLFNVAFQQTRRPRHPGRAC